MLFFQRVGGHNRTNQFSVEIEFLDEKDDLYPYSSFKAL